jgi:hypothetical protein
MGSRIGALKIAASRRCLSLEEYRAKIDAGLKWCTGCKEWHPVEQFNADRSRGDSRAVRCAMSDQSRDRRSYFRREKEPKPRRGIRIISARDGDKRQARSRVNILVRSGIIAAPGTLPCLDCGDVRQRHTYDHHLGYAAEHHEHVQPVCYQCHALRSVQRGEVKCKKRP